MTKRRYTQTDTRDGRRAGEKFDLPDGDDAPAGAVPDYDARDAVIHLRRSGMDQMADAVEQVLLEHAATSNSEQRLLKSQSYDADRLNAAEQKAALVDRLLREDGDLVVFSKSKQKVLSVDELRGIAEGREPAAPVEQVNEQAMSLLGGGGNFDA